MMIINVIMYDRSLVSSLWYYIGETADFKWREERTLQWQQVNASPDSEQVLKCKPSAEI